MSLFSLPVFIMKNYSDPTFSIGTTCAD